MQAAREQGFVGRMDELSIAERLIRSVPEGVGRVLFIEGEAGIGKSRFVDEIAAEAATAGFVAHRGAARQLDREVPFAPLLQAVDVRDASTEGILDAIEAAADRGPTLVALEDLHWADSSTFQVLARTSKLLALLPLMMVCTARPHPRSRELRAFVAEVQDSGTIIQLEPLLRKEVADLTAEFLQRPPGPNLLDELDRAGGNPFFVVQLLSAIREEGSLTEVAEAVDVSQTEVPPSMRVTILRRLSYLSDRTLETLQVAAVLGTRFEVALLSALVGRPAAALYAELNDALKAQLLVEHANELAFRHDLVRDALYDDLPATVRKALHADAAATMDRMGRPATSVAGHVVRSAMKGDVNAVAMLRQAAAEIARTAPNEAAELLEHALAIAQPDLPDTDLVRAEYAAALLAAGRLDDAEAVARTVIARRGGGPSEARARTVLVRSLRYRGRLDESVDELERAAARAGDDHERAALLAEAARSLTQLGELQRAHDVAGTAITIAEKVGDDAALALALVADAASWLVGSRRASDELIDRALTLVGTDLREAWRADVVLLASLVLGNWRERRGEIINLLQRGLRAAEEAGLTWSLPEYHAALGVIHHRSGDLADAAAEIEVARELAAGLETTWYQDAYIAARLARLAVARGDLPAAKALLAEGEALRPSVDLRHENAAQFAYARASIAQAEGRASDVVEIVSRALGQIEGRPGWEYLLVFFIDFVPLMLDAGRRDDVVRMHRLLSSFLPPLGESSQAPLLRLQALLDDDPAIALEALELVLAHDDFPAETTVLMEVAADLLIRSGRPEEAVAHLTSALERWNASGATLFAARVTARLRSIGVRPGVRGARARPSTGWESLTETERRVVELVGQGLVYREIAERMFVSRRTVETHVGHVFEKLGVSSRKELRDLMVQQSSSITSGPGPVVPQ